jgi:hypothetical protein
MTVFDMFSVVFPSLFLGQYIKLSLRAPLFSLQYHTILLKNQKGPTGAPYFPPCSFVKSTTWLELCSRLLALSPFQNTHDARLSLFWYLTTYLTKICLAASALSKCRRGRQHVGQRSLRKHCKSTQDHSMFSVFYPAPLIRAVYKPFFARSSSSSLSHFTSQNPKQSPMDSMSGWLLLFPKYWNGAKNVLVCSLFCPFSGLKIRHCHGMRRFASCLQKERRRAWPLEKEKDETK